MTAVLFCDSIVKAVCLTIALQHGDEPWKVAIIGVGLGASLTLAFVGLIRE